jgi:hypothetical protein
MGTVNQPARFATVEELLAHARTGLDRLDPHQAAAAVAAGAQLVDIRPVWQRTAMGEVPGSPLGLASAGSCCAHRAIPHRWPRLPCCR